MSERDDAEILEIVGGETVDQLAIDVVGREDGRVLRKAQRFEPRGNVGRWGMSGHGRCASVGAFEGSYPAAVNLA